MNVKIDMPDFSKLEAKVEGVLEDKAVGEAFSKALADFAEQYTPYDTGNLLNSLKLEPFKLTYECDYASYLYNNSSIPFKHEKHPLATNAWVEVALTNHYDDITSAVDKVVEKQMKGV